MYKQSAILLLLLLFIGFSAYGQQANPISWDYDVEFVDENTCEVRLTVTLEDGWYIYSQHMEEGGPFPTKITFEENKQVALQDSVREEGELIEKYEELFMMQTRYYKDKVMFIQNVKRSGTTPVRLSGTVTYMVCDPDQCLPPKTELFEVVLQ